MPSSLSFMPSLNSIFLFENFVIGKANKFAYSAATQLVSSNGRIYNSLFIYGGAGVGKTHLMQAIGNKFQKENKQAEICYVHARTSVSDFVRSLQSRQLTKFRQYYNSLDLLLVDDIQSIAKATGSQKEFLDTLNTLIDSDKQVVLTGNTFPSDIPGIEPQLTSRFTGGLTVAIEPPCLEM